jgi:hypothetical protein
MTSGFRPWSKFNRYGWSKFKRRQPPAKAGGLNLVRDNKIGEEK